MLADNLHGQVSLDLNALFADLAGAFTGVDFGRARFDAAGILGIVAGATAPDLTGLRSTVDRVSGSLGGRLGAGLPGGELPGQVEELSKMLGGITSLFPSSAPAPSIGLDGLSARFAALQQAVNDGPLIGLFGLLPELRAAETVGRVGGTFAGLIDLVRVLAGLTATSTLTARLVGRSERLTTDLLAAATSGSTLAHAAGDFQLLAAIRSVDPDDPGGVELVVDRIVEFLESVIGVQQQWSLGMGMGEVALIGVDLAAGATGLELARAVLNGVDLVSVTGLVQELVGVGRPFLELTLPIPSPGALMDEALGLVGKLTEQVRRFDATVVVAPLTRLTDLAVGPLNEVRRSVETVANAAASSIRSIREIVTEVDLQAVTDAIHRSIQPVVDTLDAVELAIGDAQAVLVDVANNITAGLGVVAGRVSTAASTVAAALATVRDALGELHLADLASGLEAELSSVAAQLAAAQLTPYFDTAISVIDTGASVIDAVPFELLPADVQQDIVDACHPIRTLDLQPIEETLRGELREIVTLFREDGLAAIEQAFADVVTFLASLDPQPRLLALETDALGTLQAALDGIDPVALLAPAQSGLDQLKGLLEGLNLTGTVMVPLSGLFQPVVDALSQIDPAALLQPITSRVDAARNTIVALLHLDTITAAVNSFRAKAEEVLARVDPAGLANALSSTVATEIARLPAAAPGGPFGSLLVTLAQASGLDATEGAVADAIAWVAGRERASTVVRDRLNTMAERLSTATAAAQAIDPAPIIAAAQAQHRAITAALAAHPPQSRLRLSVDSSLTNTVPSTLLGPLVENRRRYVGRLEADLALATTMAASGRSELDMAAAQLRAALVPLDGFAAKARALLGALGVAAATASLPELLRSLLEIAGPARVVPALTQLAGALRDKATAVIAAATQPVLDAVTTVRAIVDAFNLDPIVSELVALHGQITAEVSALSPATLLGAVIGEADAVLNRLRTFDPLAPVRGVIDAAKSVGEAILVSARPTIVFAPVVQLHGEVVGLARGLDVGALLGPVLDALTAIVAQLDDGFDRTGDALARLQASLPSAVAATGGRVSAGVSVGVG